MELRRGLIQDARCFLDISSRGCEDERVPVPLWGQAALPALVLETQPGTRIWPCGIFPVTLAKVPPPGGDGAGDAVLGAAARAQHLGALVPPGSRVLPAFSRVMNQLLPVGAFNPAWCCPSPLSASLWSQDVPWSGFPRCFAGQKVFGSLLLETFGCCKEPAVITVTRGLSPGDKSLTCSDRLGADGCW